MSPLSRNTVPANRKFRTLKTEYPTTKEYRSNSVAITKITAKRKAEKMKTESLININTQKQLASDKSVVGIEEKAAPAEMNVEMGDVSAKNLLWKKLSV